MAFPHAFNRSGGEQDARLPTQVLSSSSSSSGSGTAANPAGFLRLADVWPKAREQCGLLLNTDGKQYGALSSCTITILDEVTSGGGGGYWDGSALLIWLFGTLTASLAAYLAAYEHDIQDRQAARGIHGAGGMTAEIEEATLDASTAIGFLLMASVFLLILYFLLKAGFNVVLVLLNCVFLIAATSQSQPSCSAPSF